MPTEEYLHTLSPGERSARRARESAEVHRFYSGTYQDVRTYFEMLFPTALHKREKLAFIEWCRIARVPSHLDHDVGGVWSAEQCWKLSATAGLFRKHLDDISAGKILPPEWAKNLPPRRRLVGLSGHFGPARIDPSSRLP